MSNLGHNIKPKPFPKVQPVARREQLAWCFYDFANSGYATVVLTAIFNAYFVGVVAAESNNYQNGTATLLWTIAMASANGLIVLTAPIIGAIADHSAAKKLFLLISTIGCVSFTALLGMIGPGDIALGMGLVILATIMFSAGEHFIAAFLPEISPPEYMGRLSGYGWTIGYLGGLLTLGLCMGYIQWAEQQQHTAVDYVPVTMQIVAVVFMLAALPAFLWLKERAIPGERQNLSGYIKIGFKRLQHTLYHARQFQDLFRFLIALTTFHAGINTVVILAAVYAQEAMGFATSDTLKLILIVNITAALGAFIFGQVQDRIGSKNCLIITLVIWICAIALAYAAAADINLFWLSANLIGLALGGSQSASRALVGQFAPPQRSGEFFGLWSLAVKLAAVIGPLTYGSAIYLMKGDHRSAILSTLFFFVAGLILLLTVNEQRGRQAALIDYHPD
jgi:UMF1 family MFS transporter